MTLSTHVLDTALGQPAVGIDVTVERCDGGDWHIIGGGRTGADGRSTDLVTALDWTPGRYRLVFATGAHLGTQAFLPQVTVEFVTTGIEHHHVPLLLAPYGYTTYRGS